MEAKRFSEDAFPAVVAVIAALSLPLQMANRGHTDSQVDKLVSMEAQDSELIADIDDLVGDDNASWDDSVLL
jgi:hypothetical protein